MPKSKPINPAANNIPSDQNSPVVVPPLKTVFGIRGYSGGGSIRCLAIRGTRNALADRLKILLDMNPSPDWIASLESAGHSAVHSSSIGSPSAVDTEIMACARENHYIVFTNDLDHGALLFATAAASPSDSRGGYPTGNC